MSSTALPKKRIAVIGAGPKAVALAVKAHVLKTQKLQDTEVVIFERTEVGSAWTGLSGYSDGEQPLCTPAERDLGYPYRSMYGIVVDREMLRYGWHRFLADKHFAYGEWVDAGRNPPRHKTLVAYLVWALRQVGNTPVIGNVQQVINVGTQWLVSYVDKTGTYGTYPEQFDGVVMTGPGPAKPLAVTDTNNVAVTSSRIFNGEDFWKRLDELSALLQQLDAPTTSAFDTDVLVIGGGGTAAATLAWLLGNGYLKRSFQVVASHAVLHTRVGSVFENKLFSDEAIWPTLSAQSQKELFNRLNRGVVWASVIDKVSTAENLTLKDGRVQSIIVDKSSGQDEIAVRVRQGNGIDVTIKPQILVDATGFDAGWFIPRVPQWPQGLTPAQVIDSLGDNLECAAPAWNLPLLHAPMLSERLGPGFASLMVLGGMSDRILRAYR